MTGTNADSVEKPKANGAKKTDKKAPGNENGMTRRKFTSWLFIGWASFTASMGSLTAVFVRFFAPNVLYEPQQTFRVGAVSDYAPREVSTLWKSKYGIWIVRLEDRIVALSTACTHLGCTPNWLASEQKFKCPCHGSAFRINGVNYEGPAPRPLERYKIYLDDEGMMVVDKTVSFREERGQWEDPESFVEV